MAQRYSAELQGVKGSTGYVFADGLAAVDTRSKITRFTRGTTDATNGALAQNDTVLVATLPKGAVPIGGKILFEALGTGVTLAVGVSGTAGAYLAATSAASAGSAALFATIALGAGVQLTAATDVIITVAGAAPDADKTIFGYIEYLKA